MARVTQDNTFVVVSFGKKNFVKELTDSRNAQELKCDKTVINIDV